MLSVEDFPQLGSKLYAREKEEIIHINSHYYMELWTKKTGI